MPIRLPSFVLALGFIAAASHAPAMAQDRSIVVASTTSTQDSGLFGYLLPIFKAKTGIEVKVIAQGTGKRSTPRGAAMRMWCSFMPNRRKRSFSPKDLA